MLRAVLRVRAYPSTPGPSPSAIPTVNSKTSLSPVGSPTGSALSSQGTPVVDLFLTDKSGQRRLEAIAREPFKYQNLQGQMAQFLLSDVSRIRQEHAEFFVVVIGQGSSRKQFEVKAKHGFEMQ